MWARVLLLGMLLSFSADLNAAGDDGGQESQMPPNSDRRCRSQPVWGIAFVHDYQTVAQQVGAYCWSCSLQDRTACIHQLVKEQARNGCQICSTIAMSFCPSAYQWWYATGLAWFGRTGSKNHYRFSLTGGCEFPPDKGPCDNLELRWFYNSKSKRCERFFYGGCYGNANNYKDINECDRCCVSPGINKPGECPAIFPNIHKFCDRLCSSDASCPGTQRCCPTFCGQQCQLPEGDTSGYCPLVIPPPSSRNGLLCYTDCNSDWECKFGFPHPQKKCCPFGDRKLCVEAVEEHPGVCPWRVEVFPFVPCKNTCSDDRDCHSTEKCCFTGCSRGCLPSGQQQQQQ